MDTGVGLSTNQVKGSDSGGTDQPVVFMAGFPEEVSILACKQ